VTVKIDTPTVSDPEIFCDGTILKTACLKEASLQPSLNEERQVSLTPSFFGWYHTVGCLATLTMTMTSPPRLRRSTTVACTAHYKWPPFSLPRVSKRRLRSTCGPLGNNGRRREGVWHLFREWFDTIVDDDYLKCPYFLLSTWNDLFVNVTRQRS